jgi:release factor glutamine methyltransferase
MPLSKTPSSGTLHEALAAARARLVGAGISPQEVAVDVEVYACEILGWDRARLLSEMRAPRPDTLEPRFSTWIARREQREPTAYILGRREFWGRDFVVSPAVLIPRPETELIVEEALAILKAGAGIGAGPSGDGISLEPRVADVGTGSGCIGVSIAADVPSVRLMATDISEDALTVARENAARHGVLDRATFVRTSYLDAVDGPFDVIVSNPPYVKDGDKPALSRQVAGYEPHVALFGGTDGLTGVTAVLDAARKLLVPGGWLIFEFGLGRDDSVEALLARYAEFRLEHFRHDLQNIPRTAVVRRKIES